MLEGIPGVRNTGRINKQANKHTDKPEANKELDFPSLWKEEEGYSSSCFQLYEDCDLREVGRDSASSTYSSSQPVTWAFVRRCKGQIPMCPEEMQF